MFRWSNFYPLELFKVFCHVQRLELPWAWARSGHWPPGGSSDCPAPPHCWGLERSQTPEVDQRVSASIRTVMTQLSKSLTGSQRFISFLSFLSMPTGTSTLPALSRHVIMCALPRKWRAKPPKAPPSKAKAHPALQLPRAPHVCSQEVTAPVVMLPNVHPQRRCFY